MGQVSDFSALWILKESWILQLLFGILIFLVCCLILYKHIIKLANDIAEQRAKVLAGSPPIEPGLYVYPGIENEMEECVSKTPDVRLITKTIRKTDWSDISFVILVKGLNHRIEVSGSSNLNDGFAAIYEKDDVWLSAKEPPESINEMIEILCAFHKDEARALKKYEFIEK